MTQETIVAAFDSAADAQAAARDLEAAGIPAGNITQHAGTDTSVASTSTSSITPAHKEKGFWARLFGEDDDYSTADSAVHDYAVYDKTLTGGGSVLSIRVDDAQADHVLDIIDRHNPVDIEERASSYASTGTTGATLGATGIGTGTTTAATTGTVGGIGSEVIELAEEALVVGKRVVNRGTTRIRRYVVETPVSESVSLHQENVSVERRPVTGTGTVGADAFTDKTIEVTEMNEEAVVGKTARVVEEVVVRKDASDRVETVNDTVRREEVEVEKVDGAPLGTATTTTTTTKPL